MEKKRLKSMYLPAIAKLDSEECSLAGLFWLDDSNSVSQIHNFDKILVLTEFRNFD
jgi:hypothetical protein